MAQNSSIEWTDATWNPIRGCTRVSEGCRNCYAERVAIRFSGKGQAYDGLAKMTNGHPQWTGKVAFVEKHLNDPLKWKEPRRIFVNSMSDLFHESIPIPAVLAMFEVMAAAKQHTFQILTKRPERMKYLLAYGEKMRVESAEHHRLICTMPLPNVWLGVSCENQATADERIPLLLQTPAAVRWISAEPLLEAIDLKHLHYKNMVEIDSVNGTHGVIRPHRGTSEKIDWVVAGGESGPGARPMHPAWARSLRDQCKAAGVPFFFKQWGEWAPYGEKQPIDHIMDAGNSLWYVAKGSHDARSRLVARAVEGTTIDNPAVHFGHSQRTAEAFKVGKKAAGRKLDGVEHNEYPQQRAEAAA